MLGIKTFFGFNLRKSVKTIAWFEVLSQFIQLFIIATAKFNHNLKKNTITLFSNANPSNSINFESLNSLSLDVVAGIKLITLIGVILLLHGIVARKRHMFLPYMCIELFYIVSMTIPVFLMLFKVDTQSLSFFAAFAMYYGVSLYMWACVVTYYQLLTKEKSQAKEESIEMKQSPYNPQIYESSPDISENAMIKPQFIYPMQSAEHRHLVNYGHLYPMLHVPTQNTAFNLPIPSAPQFHISTEKICNDETDCVTDVCDDNVNDPENCDDIDQQDTNCKKNDPNDGNSDASQNIDDTITVEIHSDEIECEIVQDLEEQHQLENDEILTEEVCNTERDCATDICDENVNHPENCDDNDLNVGNCDKNQNLDETITVEIQNNEIECETAQDFDASIGK